VAELTVITLAKICEGDLLRTLSSLDSISLNFRHILVIGESSDESLELARSYAKALPIKRRVIEDEKIGIYAAMNQALRHCHENDYAWFLNAGDELYSARHLELAFNMLIQNDSDWGFGCSVVTSQYSRNQEKLVALVEPSIYSQLMLKSPINHQQTIMRVRMIRELGGFDETYKVASDWKLICEAFISEKSSSQWNFAISRFFLGGFAERNMPTGNVELLKLRRIYLHSEFTIFQLVNSYLLFIRQLIKIYAFRLLSKLSPKFVDFLRFRNKQMKLKI